MRRRLLALAMAFCMAISLLPVTAWAGYTNSCTDSCSHEAAIGTTHYDTLQEALTAAVSGETVYLLKDIDNSVDASGYQSGLSYTLKAGTTLDGNRHTLSGHIGVNIPAEGATVQNVKFQNIHNNTPAKQEDCDKYGWDSKIGTQSAIYASGLTGTATITGCTFDNADWDAIQITPNATTAQIVIKNNIFQHTNATDTQLRYVHVEHLGRKNSGSKIKELTVTDNQFFSTKNQGNKINSIGIWYVNNTTTTLNISGNYVEDRDTAAVGYGLIKNDLYPMRSQANVDEDDIMPVAYNATDVFFTIQEAVDAVDQNEKYVRLRTDSEQTAVIPAGKEIIFYPYGHSMGTLTNNGVLTISGSELAANSQIINNGALTLSGNSATVYNIVNNSALEIISGVTYDLSKITGSGSVTITGGTFSTKPDDALLEVWYIARERNGGTYQVSKRTISEAVDAGMVAASGISGSTLDFYTSVTQGLNTTEKQNTVLHRDCTEDVVISTPMEQYMGIRVLNSNGYTFTGSLAVNAGCGSVRLYGKKDSSSDKITLTNVTGELLYVGGNQTVANATIQDAQLGTLDVVGYGNCTVEGGQYKNVVMDFYYRSGKTYAPELSITGGSFASGTVTVNHSNSTPSEIVPLSDYVAEDYMVVTGTGAYPYQVVKAEGNAAQVVPAAPDVELPQNLEEEDSKAANEVKTALEASTDLVTGSGVDAAANTQANKNTVTVEEGKTALENAKVTIEENAIVTIVIQPYMDVTIKDVDTNAKTLTLDITPMYRTVATTATLDAEAPSDIEDIRVQGDNGISNPNAVKIQSGKLNIAAGANVEIAIPLPNGFLDSTETPVYVQHKGYEYTARVTSVSGAYIATFNNPHGFSEFTISTTSQEVATVGTDTYTDFQKAVDAVSNNGTVSVTQVPAGGKLTASSNKTFTVKNETGSQITVTINGTEYTIAADGSQMITYTTPSTPSQSSSSSDYLVSVESSKNGTVTVSPSRADKGGTVTITVKPNTGYELDTLTVTDKNGDSVKVTYKSANKYTFTMPGSKVTIKATFAEISEDLPFTDVAAGAWYYDAVRFVYENGLMNGVTSTTFGPNVTTSRAMLATILYRLEGEPRVTAASFTDVESGMYYTDAVAWASSKGIVTGYGDGTFLPNKAITREEMAAMLYRYAKYKGYDVSVGEDTNILSYTDAFDVSEYAIPAMQWACGAGLVTDMGNGTLTPAGPAVRAQIATILMRFLGE